MDMVIVYIQRLLSMMTDLLESIQWIYEREQKIDIDYQNSNNNKNPIEFHPKTYLTGFENIGKSELELLLFLWIPDLVGVSIWLLAEKESIVSSFGP